ncbi:MAG: type I methionyl aminopeptidase [bacterium]
MIILKSKEEIERIRIAGEIIKNTFLKLLDMIKPGVTTLYLNNIAHNLIVKEGGKPAFLGYRGFPCSICTSINEEVIHGIPSKRSLKNGDLLKVDIGVFYKGYCADAARTYGIGDISPLCYKLKDVAIEAFKKALPHCKRQAGIKDISSAIQNYVEGFGFSVVRDFGGHGIGKELHEEPEVLNYVSKEDVPLKEGMVFCIEPMVNEGKSDVFIHSNKWTVITKDRKLSSHFEETVAITNNGALILT